MSALVTASPDRLAAAYAYCESLARRHYENFPVASRLLPGAMRPHIAAIYAFARCADDFADEPGRSAAERLRLLDYWQVRLKPDTTVDSRIRLQPATPGDSEVRVKPDTTVNDDFIFLALANTMRTHNLPVGLFEDLLSAFRQDVQTTRYATWGDVLDYCRRSANPVGRLVLRVAGCNDARTDAASDALCTALQLTNFWQDFARDWENGRLYIPLEERDRAGASEVGLNGARLSREWKSALQGAAVRTRALFEAGRPVCAAVTGRLRWELRLTWLGGVRILDRLEAADFDVFALRPTIGVRDVVPLFWQALRWK